MIGVRPRASDRQRDACVRRRDARVLDVDRPRRLTGSPGAPPRDRHAVLNTRRCGDRTPTRLPRRCAAMYLWQMVAVPSQEIESVVRRTIVAYNAGSEALGNLMSSDPSLRVLGFDRDEYWRSNAEFVGVRTMQTSEAPDSSIHVDLVDAFQDGDFGWATLFSTFRTPEAETHLRSTAVLRLEAGNLAGHPVAQLEPGLQPAGLWRRSDDDTGRTRRLGPRRRRSTPRCIVHRGHHDAGVHRHRRLHAVRRGGGRSGLGEEPSPNTRPPSAQRQPPKAAPS